MYTQQTKNKKCLKVKPNSQTLEQTFNTNPEMDHNIGGKDWLIEDNKFHKEK